jgi:hypothetical protein
VAQEPSWSSLDPIVVGNWTVLTDDESGNEWILGKDAATPPDSPYKRLWARWEKLSPEPESSILSTAVLYEIDCVERRSRELSVSIYRENNLKGGSVGGSSVPREWTYSPPGSIGEIIVGHAC